MPNQFIVVGGRETASKTSEVQIDLEEFNQLQAEVCVLRDVYASLAEDRNRILAEKEELRAALKQFSSRTRKDVAGAKKSAAVAKRRVSHVRVQYGALPYRVTLAGSLEFLLITTKQSKRWIVPKGRRIKGLKPAKCAAREAFEEAGIRGAIEKKSIGAFSFLKTVDDGLAVMCKVNIYPLKVKRELRDWPEAPRRTQRWFEPSAALAAVNDVGLKSVIHRFVEKMAASAPSAPAPSAPVN